MNLKGVGTNMKYFTNIRETISQQKYLNLISTNNIP